MKKNFFKKIYYQLLRIRMIEEKISLKYSEKKIRCPVHLSIGQESSAVGIASNLFFSDRVVTAHRSHAHYLSKGGDLKAMIAELYGKQTGCASGKGGSMHLIDERVGLKAAVPIVGSTIPIGVGIAWSLKLNKSNNICVIFFGDGATEEGVFLESLDFASLKNLPCLFVCENNHYSVFSHIDKRQSKRRNLLKLSEALGIQSTKINSNNVFEISNKTNLIIKKIRKMSSPHFILVDTFRSLEHCGPNNDDNLNYRDKNYINYWKKKCPIKIAENFLLNNKILNIKEIENFKIKIIKEIDDAFNFAEKSKFPKKNQLMKNIYA